MSPTIQIQSLKKTGEKEEITRNLPGIAHRSYRLDFPVYRKIKRMMDIILGGIMALLILPWLIPIVAILVKLDSKGPVFFIQKRSGRDCRTFGCIKFRTMVVNSDANRIQVQAGDNRITITGKILRRFHIDELPQLINVLMGDMSLVGPRPHMLRHNVMYSRLIDNYHQRHKVKPGMTGLAQVRGYHGMVNSTEDVFNRCSSDIEYIATWSVWTDLKIAALTLVHIIKNV